MKNILSIQSHVAYGHVGNRSAVFPLERMGYEVWPVNTVQFSSHTGYPGWTGASFGGDHLSAIVGSLQRMGALAACDAVLSGYMADVETGSAIMAAVDMVKKEHPGALYCCDPVMGDEPGGVYVQADIPEFMRHEAIPRADIACPNIFEAELLSGIGIHSAIEAARAVDRIHAMGPRIVILTSYRPFPGGPVGFYISDGDRNHVVMTPTLAFGRPPKGSGDLASSLFLGYFLASSDPVAAIESTASALYSVLEATLSSHKDELAIVASQETIANPPRRFRAESPDTISFGG
ncbi:MAG TPA: pyridoxal kinase PdxY [bacterium]|nr:pyridoxal kinase PdxY [bacterium]